VRGMEWFDPLEPHAYCIAKTNSQGCTPEIGWSGTASLSGPDDFFVTATQVLNNKSGYLLWSLNPTEVPFNGGSLCLDTTIRRTPAQFSGGNPPPNDCSGTFSFHFSNAFFGAQGIVAGNEISAQYFYRDGAHPDGTGYGMTNAVRFPVLP
jgi:hypothetical protein